MFNGPEYNPKHDYARLHSQIDRIKYLMLDGEWRTLSEIEKLTGDPSASISAQLRHLRKKRFGYFIVERRSRGTRIKGLFEYRLLPPDIDHIKKMEKQGKTKAELYKEIEFWKNRAKHYKKHYLMSLK